MNDIKGFTFFQSYYEALKDVSVEDRKEIINAILEFVFEDKEPVFTGSNKAIWTLIKPNLKTSKNKSKSKQNQNEIKSKSNEKEEQNKNASEESQAELSDLHDKDKEEDKDKEKNMDKDDGDDVLKYYEKNIEKICPATTETLSELSKTNSTELMKKAIDIAVLRGKKNLDYIQGILKSWKEKGYKTLLEVEKEQENPKQKNKQSHSFQNDVNNLETEALYDN